MRVRSAASILFAWAIGIPCFLTHGTDAKTMCLFSNQLCVTVEDRGESVNITMVTTAQGYPYVAVGLNTAARMEGADVMLAWLNADGSVTVSDRHNIGYTPTVDTSQDLRLLTGSGKRLDGTSVFMLERSKLAKGPPGEDLEIRNAAQFWVFAMATASSKNPGSSGPGASISKHTYAVAPGPLNFLEGGSAVVAESGPSETVLVSHGALMFLAWNVCIPAAILVAMFGKPKLGAQWFRVHVGLVTVAGVLMLIGFLLIVTSTSDHFDSTHAKLGFSVLLLTFLVQVPLGGFIHHQYVRNRNRSAIPWYNFAHYWIGRGVFVLSLVTIPLGLALLGASTVVTVFWYVWIVGIGLIVGVGLWKMQPSKAAVLDSAKNVRGNEHVMNEM